MARVAGVVVYENIGGRLLTKVRRGGIIRQLAVQTSTLVSGGMLG